MGEDIFQMIHLMSLMSKIYKKLIQLTLKKKIKKWAEALRS